MGVALVTCSECGESVRRDDGALSPASEQPKRVVLTSGSQPVYTLDYCNGCFAGVLLSLDQRQQLKSRALAPQQDEEQEERIE